MLERKYVGPAQAEDLDADEFFISTAPLRAGPSAGASAGSAAWLGHADNWRVSLQGRYASVDQAVQRVAVLCGGEFRRVEVPADRPGVVQCFKPGRLRPMGAQASIEFVEPAAQEDVTAHSTDEQLDALVQEYVTLSELEGLKLHRQAVRQYLDSLKHSNVAGNGPRAPR